MQTLKLNEKLSIFRRQLWLLCRSNSRLIFLVDSSLALFWVSLEFQERSEDTANFPLTLNNFFTSCAKWHKNSNWANILTFDFYPKYFHKNCRYSAIFDLSRFIFDILTAKTDLCCTPWMEVHVTISSYACLTLYIKTNDSCLLEYVKIFNYFTYLLETICPVREIVKLIWHILII